MDPVPLFDQSIFRFFRQARCGAAGSRRPLRLLEAALFQRRQAARRKRNAKAGLVVPPILIASLTRRCNLHCKGCYSQTLRPEAGGSTQELPDAKFMELFREAVGLGVGSILLAGGEPLLRKELVEEASRLKGMLLPLFTNGTMLDEAFLETLGRSSIVPILSIEGEAEATDTRRGPGIHATAERWAAEMRKRGLLFGASITLTSHNADEVLSPDYLGKLGESGISVLFLVEYVPVAPGSEGLVLGPEQKLALGGAGLFAGLPYPVVVLPGDEEAYGGCLAAGRGFVHLSSEGRIEACPFAPFSDTDAGELGLRAALASPLMAAIRERHGELSETRGGCALWNRSGWVAALGASCPGPREEGGAEAMPSTDKVGLPKV
jgi:MoaA/NifB/PqqE/SkfB family radical SAM enzyme